MKKKSYNQIDIIIKREISILTMLSSFFSKMFLYYAAIETKILEKARIHFVLKNDKNSNIFEITEKFFL